MPKRLACTLFLLMCAVATVQMRANQVALQNSSLENVSKEQLLQIINLLIQQQANEMGNATEMNVPPQALPLQLQVPSAGNAPRPSSSDEFAAVTVNSIATFFTDVMLAENPEQMAKGACSIVTNLISAITAKKRRLPTHTLEANPAQEQLSKLLSDLTTVIAKYELSEENAQ